MPVGDQRTQAYACAFHAVHSEEGMTDWVLLTYEAFKRISSRIVNEIRGVNRIVYASPPNHWVRLSGSRRPWSGIFFET
jgi:GMP synthase PP-ATPase subunit